MPGPVTRTLTNVGDPLIRADGSVIVGATITFALVDETGAAVTVLDLEGGELVHPIPVVETTDANGEFTTAIWANDRGNTPSRYKVTIAVTGEKRQIRYGSAVDGVGDVQWKDFLAAEEEAIASEVTTLAAHVQDSNNPHGTAFTQIKETLFGASADVPGEDSKFAFLTSAEVLRNCTPAQLGAAVSTWKDARFVGGCIPDGDGVGGGTDNTEYFQAAYDACTAGDILFFPFAGTGIYRIDGEITGKAGVTLQLFGGVKIDFTNKTTGKGLSFSGTVGSEIALGANATRGDTTIVAATDHDLVAGDWFLLMSQRSSLHEDGGDWQLGITTGGGSQSYFAEPCQVASVTSPTEVEISAPLIFPDYRTDRTEETLVGTRVSTIKKINFIEGIKIIGGEFIIRGDSPTDATTAIHLSWAKEPTIDGVTVDLGGMPGCAVKAHGCLRGSIKTKAYRPAVWSLDGVDHSQFNSFKDAGSWWMKWDYTDIHGSQGLDVTYASGVTPYHPSICPTIKAVSYDAHEDGLTFHGGAYGGLVENFKAYNCLLHGIYNRSRNVRIVNPTIISQTSTSSTEAGVLHEGYVFGSSVEGGYIEGCNNGIYSKRNSSVGDAPAGQKLTITGTKINRVGHGVKLITSTTADIPNADDSGIVIRNIAVQDYIGDGAVLVDDYVNGVEIDGVDCNGAIDSLAQRGINIRANTINIKVKNITGRNLKAGDTLVSTLGLTDTTTFPVATYPTNRHKVDVSSIHLIGDGAVSSLSQASPGGHIHVTNADLTLGLYNAEQIVGMSSASARTCTVPPAADVPFPLGTVIRIRQQGAGQGTIAPGAGVTINSRSGLKTAGQFAVITLTKTGTDTWYLSGDTAV